MNFRLVQTGWDAEFDHAAKGCRGVLCIVTHSCNPMRYTACLSSIREVSVITRFNLTSCTGVSAACRPCVTWWMLGRK